MENRTEELIERLKSLKEARLQRESLETEFKAKQAELSSQLDAIMSKHRNENHELIALYEQMQATEKEAEAEVRKALVDDYTVTGRKLIAKGFGVRVNTRYKYDVDKAVEWCKENAPFCLTIDKKQFESLASAASSIITVEETPTAVLPTDLDRAIEEASKLVA